MEISWFRLNKFETLYGWKLNIKFNYSNAYWPLEPEFAGSNPAEAFGFFGCP